MTVVASIGTLHPWNVAGAGLDLRAAADLHVRVVTALGALSVQDAHGVRGLYDVAHHVFEAQLASLPWETVGAVRVGALPNRHAHEALRTALGERDIPIVVDPVLQASTGGALAADDAVEALSMWLADARAVVTPNVGEAAVLLGTQLPSVEAAAALQGRGARAVVVKGGHASGDAVDVVADASGVWSVASARLAVDMRGTGCLFALALASKLATGVNVRDGVAFAHAFVRERLLHATQFAGMSVAY